MTYFEYQIEYKLKGINNPFEADLQSGSIASEEISQILGFLFLRSPREIKSSIG